MKHLGLLLVSAIAALCGFFLFAHTRAQSVFAQQAEMAGHAPDGDSFERIINITIPPVQHAPFTSIVTAEWTKTLEDGSTLTRQNRRVVVRDASGRIFQERRWLVPKDGQEESFLMRTEISDPNQHTKYFCRPQDHVCMLQDYDGPPAEVSEAVGSQDDGKTTLTREDLGKSNVSGLEVVGTRETRTIAAGVLGNDRPLTVTKELWYSPQLGLNMLVKRNDPRTGVQTFTVTEVGLADPDPKYFQLPAGYTVKDMRQPAVKAKGAQ
jgi:hypothetical protein